MMRLLYIYLILFCSLSGYVFGNEAHLDTANIRVGCWVEYNVVIDENPKERISFNCFIKLYKAEGDLLDFEYKIDGIGKRIELARKDFPLARLIPDINPATSFKESTEEKFVFAELGNTAVDTIHDLWNYENGVTEVWSSKDVPFSIVKIVCKGFSMELRAYSWAKE